MRTRTAASLLAAAALVLLLASPASALVTAPGPVVHIDAAPSDPVGHVVRLVLLGATLLGIAGLAGLYLTRGRR